MTDYLQSYDSSIDKLRDAIRWSQNEVKQLRFALVKLRKDLDEVLDEDMCLYVDRVLAESNRRQRKEKLDQFNTQFDDRIKAASFLE